MGTGVGQFIPIFIYIGFICASLLAFLWRPQIGLYFLILLLPLQTTRARLQEFPLGENMIYIIILSSLGGILLRRFHKPFPKTPLNGVVLVYVIFIYFSLWLGAFNLDLPLPLWSNSSSLIAWKDFMAMPLLLLVTLGCIRDVRQMKLIIVLMCLSNLLVDRSFILEILGRDFSHFIEDKRQAGPLGYAGVNGFAAFESQLSLLLLGILPFIQKRALKIAGYSLVALNGYCILYSFSRGAYIAILAGLSLYAILKRRWLLVPLVAFAFSWQLVVPTPVYERVVMTYGKDKQLEISAAERISLWEDASQLIASSPIIGTGYNTYSHMGRLQNLRDTHNLYLKILVETGIVGLLLVLAIFAKVIRSAFFLYKAANEPFFNALGLGVVLCMAGVITVNIFGDRWTFIEIDGFLWVLFGLVMRARLLVTEPMLQEKNIRQTAYLPDESAPAGLLV